ncbi:FAD-dependent oxidoreductase [Deinococcus misasensis]|uniref:FAD-dependent oxidoreductase n=1 Tax=Deinococcus misasensis TaxID=392413 RepID=UPI0009FD740F|nr:FAD-dependent oxidoreductase [Deinococcus misasensis]
MPKLRVNGHKIHSRAGISVLAALQNQGLWTVRTSVSGKPRGPLCGMGVCYECRCLVDGRVQKSCQVTVQEGMEVETAEGKDSLSSQTLLEEVAEGREQKAEGKKELTLSPHEKNRSSSQAKQFPQGLGLQPSAFCSIPSAFSLLPSTNSLLIIGAGPAGIAAARAASRACQVTLLDDNPRIGGQIWREKEGLKLPENVQVLSGAPITGVLDDKTLLVAGQKLHFERLILATGARELLLPFPGWTLPGVVGAGGLQAMIKSGLDVAGKRIVIAGSGPLLLAVAALAVQKGAQVVRILEQAPPKQLAPFLKSLTASKLLQAAGLGRIAATRYTSNAYVKAALGTEKLEKVQYQSGERTLELECDLLAVGYGLVPNLELAVQLGCRLDQGFVQVDDTGKTSVAHIHAAGEITGIGGLDKALLEGEVAGLAATGQPIFSLVPRLQASHRFVRTLKTAFALRPELQQLADSDTIICRCEDVRLAEVQGHTDWRSAKLHTRLGMGACQGRTCGPICQHLLGFDAPQIRPPLFATPLEDLLLEEQP